MLVDTSVWLRFFLKAQESVVPYLDAQLNSAEPIYICPVILQESILGFKENKDYKNALDQLQILDLLVLNNQRQAAIAAAEIYRKCRKKGLTIRKPNDCLIAYYALTYDVELLHWDNDFNAIAQVFPLKIHPETKPKNLF